ncbi:hypothetical protein [Sorangium sp. So ce1024]|uniref:hypothetical protein n=1 Tax=Sorangium sp. So ce1024 TaxID=3133327 RepID=UPI003F032852
MTPTAAAPAAAPAPAAPAPPRADRPRFTLCGDPRAEMAIARDLASIAASTEELLGPRLCGLLLIGGYARGEGGVVERAGELGPFNDYDLVAVLRGRAAGRHERARLRDLGHAWTQRLGVDVDLLPLSEADLPRLPPTLFWLDAALGGVRVVMGPSALAGRLPRLSPRRVSLDECGRLLMNRATGLALSNLEPSAGNEDRIARHGHKAAFACGDVRLLACGRYRPSHVEKLAELERLEDCPAVGADLVAAYRDAVAFRTRPDRWRPPGGDVAAWYARLRALVARWHLDHEAWRTGAPADPRAYAAFRGRLFRDLPDVRPGAAPLAALRAAATGAAPLLPYVGHPRERLARVAVALAYAPDEPASRAAAERLLGVPAGATDAVLRERLRALVQRGG